jgi:acyl-ACP thioesterase
VEVSRLQFRRDFELYSSSGVLLGRAITQWVILNLTTRKLERVPKFVSDCHPHNPKYAMQESDWKIEAQADSPVMASFSVKRSDIDIMNHVNNIRYLEWIIDTLPASYSKPSMVEILFRAEAVENDAICAKGKSSEDGKFSVSLFKNDTELIRARIA